MNLFNVYPLYNVKPTHAKMCYVYDENGTLISKNEWNLLTGRKATIIVYQD